MNRSSPAAPSAQCPYILSRSISCLFGAPCVGADPRSYVDCSRHSPPRANRVLRCLPGRTCDSRSARLLGRLVGHRCCSGVGMRHQRDSLGKPPECRKVVVLSERVPAHRTCAYLRVAPMSRLPGCLTPAEERADGGRTERGPQKENGLEAGPNGGTPWGGWSGISAGSEKHSRSSWRGWPRVRDPPSPTSSQTRRREYLRAWLVLAILGGLAVTGLFVALYERPRSTDRAAR